MVRVIVAISIITPAYNASATIDRTIQSVAGVFGDVDLRHVEVIVINDGSTDDTWKKVEGWRDRGLPWQFIAIDNESNLGAGPSRNRGLERATGEWVMFLDADDELVLNPIPHLSANSSHSAIFFESVSYVGKMKVVLAPRSIGCETHLRQFSISNPVAICSLIVSRRCITQPFPDSSYLEDWEFWLRNREVFAGVVIVREVLAKINARPDSSTTNVKEMASRRIAVADTYLSAAGDQVTRNNFRVQREIGELMLKSRRFANIFRCPVSFAVYCTLLFHQLSRWVGFSWKRTAKPML